MSTPVFEKRVIGELVNDVCVARMNTLGAIGDFNGDGRTDYLVCGRYGRMAWFENYGGDRAWKMHDCGMVTAQECGGTAFDLTGNGLCDIINGSEGSMDEMSWWENPGRDGAVWQRRIIAKTNIGQMHDTLIGEIKNDGVKYLVFTNQGVGTSVFCVPIPSDATQSPWPGLEEIASDKKLPNPQRGSACGGMQPDEGLALGDVDGDGKLELVSGVSYYKWADGKWNCHRFTDKNYITNKILVCDIDADGCNEIILSEGDAYIYGHDEGCKVAYFKMSPETPDGYWKEHVIATGLLDAHSIQAADLCGNGRLDLFVGEIGAVKRGSACEDYILRAPRLMIYENTGNGTFSKCHIIDEGTGIHEGRLVDLDGDGMLDIIGKPLHGPEKWKIHAWYRRR